jgi:hypothetical protein
LLSLLPLVSCTQQVTRDLKRPYSTRELHQICDRLESWGDLRPGDILLNHQHVVLFVRRNLPGREISGYEAGPYPVWKVSACGLSTAKLLKAGYAPWRYRGIVENP